MITKFTSQANTTELERIVPSIHTQSKGILKRYSRYPLWQNHLATTKQCVQQWVNKITQPDELNILGAGSLLDLDLKKVSTNIKKIILTDASSFCVSEWKKQSKKLTDIPLFVIQDITGVLLHWYQCMIQKESENIDEYIDFIKRLPISIPPLENFFISSTNILSLNLLSQLPIYWQDVVFTFLRKKFGSRKVDMHKEYILNAVCQCGIAMINAHFRGILPKKVSQKTLLITDLYYFFDLQIRENDISFIGSQILPHISQQAQRPPIEHNDALFGFDLETEISTLRKGFNFFLSKAWIWEIVPKGTYEEQETHLVVALEIEKKPYVKT